MSDGPSGLEAVRAGNYARGVELLDKALRERQSPAWLLARSKAHQMLKNLDLALEDAESAYHAAYDRGSGDTRKQLIEAQYRRAVCLFQLKRYADADCCAKWSMLLAEGRPTKEKDGVEEKVDENGNYTVTKEQAMNDTDNNPTKKTDGNSAMWAMAAADNQKKGYGTVWNTAYAFRSQVLANMEKAPADHPGRKVTVTKTPPKHMKRTTGGEQIVKADASKKPTTVPSKITSTVSAPAPSPAKAPERGPVPLEKLKLRSDFYQTNDSLTVTFFVKGVKKEDLYVQLLADKAVLGPLPRQAAPWFTAEEDESYSTFAYHDKVKEAESKLTCTPNKVELQLKKAAPGKWATWGQELVGQRSSQAPTAESAKTDNAPPKQERESTQASQEPQEQDVKKQKSNTNKAPAYPTSSKHGPKDWDHMALDEKDDEDDVNGFMKKLYAGATAEQQRAMLKSFTESNGTVLSTNWNEVKNGKVETSPPSGVEAKKW